MSEYLWAPVAAWFIAQLIKFATTAFQGNINFTLLWKSGGMPSSHTSIAVALATVTLVLDGLNSSIFGVAAIMAMIIIYDAVGVRRSVQHLIPVVAKLAEKSRVEIDESFLHSKGHSRKEVFFGAFNGIAFGLLFTSSRWSSKLSLLTDIPNNQENLLFSILFGLAGLAGIVILVISSIKRLKDLPTFISLRKMAAWSLIMPSVSAATLFMAKNAGIEHLSWRLWFWVLASGTVVTQIVLSFKWYGDISEDLVNERVLIEEKKRLEKRRKKRVKQKRKKR